MKASPAGHAFGCPFVPLFKVSSFSRILTSDLVSTNSIAHEESFHGEGTCHGFTIWANKFPVTAAGLPHHFHPREQPY